MGCHLVVGIAVQHIKLPPVTLIFHMGTVPVPAASLLIQLPVGGLGKETEDGLSV